jgi:hypothetical protein
LSRRWTKIVERNVFVRMVALIGFIGALFDAEKLDDVASSGN